MKAVIFDPDRKEHRPLSSGEKVDADSFALSLVAGNRLKAFTDGLYAGDHPIPATISVDPVNGIDQPLGSVATTPLQSLDYALAAIEEAKPSQITVLLKSGYSYSVSRTYNLVNVDLTFSFFGDAKYPSDGYYTTSKIKNRFQGDLTRPVIATSGYKDPITDCWVLNRLNLFNSNIRLHGVLVTLPAAPSQSLAESFYGKGSDFLVSFNSKVFLEGTIVNRLSEDSCYGLLAIPSRYGASLSMVHSRLLVEGNPVEASTINSGAFDNTVQTIIKLKYFIKLDLDYPVDDSKNNEVSITRGSTATGILNLLLTNSVSALDSVTGANTLASFPGTDRTYGIQNYIFNISRDQQSRPLNVICATLI